MDPEIVAAMIGPVLTAGLAAPAVGFKEWRRRESADRQHETLRQAADEVAFIDAWLSAYPPWPDNSYRGPMPSTPGQVGAGYRPAG